MGVVTTPPKEDQGLHTVMPGAEYSDLTDIISKVSLLSMRCAVVSTFVIIKLTAEIVVGLLIEVTRESSDFIFEIPYSAMLILWRRRWLMRGEDNC